MLFCLVLFFLGGGGGEAEVAHEIALRTNLRDGRRRPQWSHDPGAVVADGAVAVVACAAAAAVELRQRHVSSLYHYILLQLIVANQLDL